MARVDVIVPCYNYARYLRACVESALAQDGVDVRVLIIDDCSTDDSETVGRELAARDRRVEYRRHAVNQKHIRTYNEGLEWAAGNYLLLLSADDMLTPGALRRAADLMDRHPEVGLVYGDPIRTQEPDFATAPRPATYDTEVISGPEFIERCCRATANLVETVTAVVRTSVQKAAGGYRPELPHAGDLEMWLRCASLAGVGRIQAPQGFYRRHGTNMSVGFVARRDHDQLRAAFESFFRTCGDRLADRERLEHHVRRGLAVEALYLANDAFNAGSPTVCADLLAEAQSLWRGVRHHRGWKRLRLKRAFGGHLWRTVRPLLGGWRRATA